MDNISNKNNLLKTIKKIINEMIIIKKRDHNRVLPFGDYLLDRWEKAQLLNFGDGASCYDNVVVIGDVIVGEKTWIGPNVVLDGSGGLEIGSYCSISAGVQIYSHDSVNWAITGGRAVYDYASTKIGNNCYIGPNTIVQKGTHIGEGVIIGANSFVNCNIPSHSKAYGNPVKIVAQEKEVI